MSSPLERLVAWAGGKLRDPNPILVKELRSTFRAKLFIRFFYLAILGVALIVLTGSAIASDASTAPAEVGRVLFQVFFTTVLGIVIVVGAAHGSTALSGEREAETLDTLLLSGMSPRRIVRGKFLASYAMLALVLIGFAPVVGITFLFGGVAPSHLVWGYYGVALWLAVAVSFGIAVSSRVPRTRLAIVLTGLLFGPASFVLLLIQTALREPAASPWSVHLEGPFWFVEALSNRLFELDTFALLLGLPTVLVALLTWFYLETASAALRPATDDRSLPFKVFALVGGFFTAALLVVLARTVPASSADDVAVGVAIASALPGMGLVLLFLDEPPLPVPERGAPARWPRLARSFGSGAAPTLRFVLLYLVLATGVMIVVLLSRGWLTGASSPSHYADAAVLLVLLGNLQVLGAFATIGAYLRAALGSGLAARIGALALFGGGTLLLALFAAIMDDGWFGRADRIPFLLWVSPLFPMLQGIQIMDKENVESAGGFAAGLVAMAPYTLATIAFWIGLHLRIQRVRAAATARRRAREDRIAERLAFRAAVPAPIEVAPPPSTDALAELEGDRVAPLDPKEPASS